MVLGLDHIQLACPRDSEEAAIAFYGQLLGLQLIEKPEALRSKGGCWFQLGHQQLHLVLEEPFQPALKAHPALVVSDTEVAFHRLTSAGTVCQWDHALPKVRRFFASDPWGNRLEFSEGGFN